MIFSQLISIGRAAFAALVLSTTTLVAHATVTPEDARAIAKEAYIYGYPIVDNYRIHYSYFVDNKDSNFKAPWNHIKSIPNVYTPADTAVQTPNSDTPYSWAGLDLRAEPIILSVPKVEKNRYYSIQLTDAYTFNFDYAGSATTGNDAGKFMVVGPNWKGEKPKGIDKVFHSETDYIVAIYRTQLFNSADIDNVKRIQKGYKVEPLSTFLGKSAPVAAPKLNYIQPTILKQANSSLEVFNVLNFILTNFAPTVPSEKALMAKFAKIHVGSGQNFQASDFSPEIQQAIKDGIADGWQAFETLKSSQIDTGTVTAADLFGTRDYLQNNYLRRMAGAIMGIYGNSKKEAVYPIYTIDSNDEKLNAEKNSYTLHFKKGEFPPVHAFWSLTMYELPSSLLTNNPINRYLINAPMLPDLTLDKDGGLTLYIQHESPGKDKESNWLPSPKGAFWLAMRLYWPKDAALDGSWKAPKLDKK